MSTDNLGRRQARCQALEILYESVVREITPKDVTKSLPTEPDGFASLILTEAQAQAEEAKGRIAEAAKGWTLERMPMMDIAIMRLALAEQALGETPEAVILSESVHLASEYSTDSSAKFINGVLSNLIQ